MHSRREILAAGIGSMVVLGRPSLLSARERPERDSHDLAARWQSSRLSGAVVHGTSEALSNVLRAGAELNDSHLAVADHAWHLMVSHLDELDFMAATDRLVVERGGLLIAGSPTDELVTSIRQLLENNRVDVPESRIRAVLTTTPDRLAVALDLLRARGSLKATLDDIQIGNAFAPLVKQTGVTSGRIHTQELGLCQTFQIMVDVVGIVGAMWGLGCALTMGACVPCCLAAAVFGLEALVLEAVHDSYC